jgi:hypothetical protein
VVSCTSYYKIRRRRFFFLQVVSRKKEEKLSTDELPTRRVQDSPLSFFCPTSRSLQESEGFFCQRATYKGKYGKAKEAVESARAGLSPQKRGHEKVKKRKDQGRREGGSSKGKVLCALNQEFLFFGSRVFGFGSGPSRLKYRLLRLFSMRKPCAKEVPEMDYFTQRKQYLKRTTLRTYSAKAVP